MLLWLARRAWNLFWNSQGDCLGRRSAFLSCDFGLPRTGSSLAVHSGSVDSLHSSSGTSSSSAWASGLKWNGPKPLKPSGPTITPQNHAARLLGREGGFRRARAYIMAGWVLFPYGCQDLEVEGSLGNWTKFILLDIPSLSFVCGELPLILPSI